jgi:hypothetical protein
MYTTCIYTTTVFITIKPSQHLNNVLINSYGHLLAYQHVLILRRLDVGTRNRRMRIKTCR